MTIKVYPFIMVDCTSDKGMNAAAVRETNL